MKVIRNRPRRKSFSGFGTRGRSTDNSKKESLGQKILYSAIAVVIMLFCVMPQFHEIRSSMAFKIILRAIISVGTLIVLWFVNMDTPLFTKSTVSAVIIVLWLELIPDSLRMTTIFSIVLFIVLLIDGFSSSNIHSIKSTNGLISLIAISFLGIRLFSLGINRITFANDNTLLYFLIASIAVSLVYAVITIWNGKHHIGTAIAYSLLVLITSFCIMIPTAAVLNFAFDFSEPVRHSVVLEDKIHHKKASNYFHVTLNGKNIELSTTSAQYFLYNEGDMLEILEYDGFFGLRYYMLAHSDTTTD